MHMVCMCVNQRVIYLFYQKCFLAFSKVAAILNFLYGGENFFVMFTQETIIGFYILYVCVSINPTGKLFGGGRDGKNQNKYIYFFF